MWEVAQKGPHEDGAEVVADDVDFFAGVEIDGAVFENGDQV